jgi:hypothetical protein
VLVSGADVDGNKGQVVLDASQWLELKARADVKTAGEAFDAAVEEFYKPLLEAAEKVGKSLERPEDSLGFVTLDEGQDHVPGRAPQIVRLTKDSMILRLIEDGGTDRLVWVGDDLEILDVLAGTGNTGVVANSSDEAAETTEAAGISGDPHQYEESGNAYLGEGNDDSDNAKPYPDSIG